MKNLIHIVVFVAALSSILTAQWVSDTLTNNPIGVATNAQSKPAVTSDGTGGAVIVWMDARNTGAASQDIFAQSINSSGVIQWGTNGTTVCAATGHQQNAVCVSNGSSGAVVVWEDHRTGFGDIYAQEMNSAGIRQWGTSGTSICDATHHQRDPKIDRDASGNVFITWRDLRDGSSENIYAQKINGSGVAQWTGNGVLVCAGINSQIVPRVAADGAGGAIIAWEDYRGGSSKVYAQRINSSGDTVWAADGVALCSASGTQTLPQIVGDGSDGAIVTWNDTRSGMDVYAQRINASGNLLWSSTGISIGSGTGNQQNPAIALDGSNGALIVWEDSRSVGTGFDIYAQLITVAGDTLWTANGIALCINSSVQTNSVVSGDGSGGGVVAWIDQRNGTFDIYAQKVNTSGVIQWGTSGVAVCAATASQADPAILNDGSGGAIITWTDQRSGSDVYASKVFTTGALPVELVSFIASTNQLNAELKWTTATEVNNYGFEVERKAIRVSSLEVREQNTNPKTQNSNQAWSRVGFVEGSGTTNAPKEYSYIDKNFSEGKPALPAGRYSYRLKQIDRDGKFAYSQTVEVEIGSLPNEFALMQNYPNPFNPSTVISYQIPVNSHVSLKVYDTIGREVATLVNEVKGVGNYSTTFNASKLSSGTYFARLSSNGKSQMKKLLLMK